MKKWKLATAAVLILLRVSPLLAHEGDSHAANTATPDQTLQARAQEQNITVRLFQYQPARLQIAPGTTVMWTNEDDVYHSITAENAAFDAPLNGRGEKFSANFKKPGTYSYYCERHEHMRGEIEVR